VHAQACTVTEETLACALLIAALRQAAAEKHGALGLAGAREKRAEAAAKRERSRTAARDKAKARLEALLAEAGVEHDSAEWHALGQSARDVDAFLEGRAQAKPPKAKAAPPAKIGKKRKLRGWGDPGAGGVLKSADDAEGACCAALRCMFVCLHARAALTLRVPSALLLCCTQLPLPRRCRAPSAASCCTSTARTPACWTWTSSQPRQPALVRPPQRWMRTHAVIEGPIHADACAAKIVR
jgi:hypothetical protein